MEERYLKLSLERFFSERIAEELETDVLVPGHGGLYDRSYIPEMSAFIQAWIDTVTTTTNQRMSLEEA